MNAVPGTPKIAARPSHGRHGRDGSAASSAGTAAVIDDLVLAIAAAVRVRVARVDEHAAERPVGMVLALVLLGRSRSRKGCEDVRLLEAHQLRSNDTVREPERASDLAAGHDGRFR